MTEPFSLSPSRPLPELSGSGRDGDDLWDQCVAADPGGTFFQTRIWAQVITASFPGLKDRSFRVESAEGPCVFPLFLWSRAGGILCTQQSVFPFLYGGPIPFPTREEEWTAILTRLRGNGATWRIIGSPFREDTAEGERAADRPLREAGFQAVTDRTHRLRLPATADGFWNEVLSPAKRNDVRRLGRKGVTVEETGQASDVDAVYRLYLASFPRWGGRPRFRYPPEFYRNLLTLGRPHVRLTVARHEGRVIGGAYTVRWNGKAHYLAGYFDHESRSLRPNVLIQVESILRAIQDRLLWYDFLPSGGHLSVEEFKESLGGRATSFTTWHRAGAWHQLLGRLRAASGD